MGLYPVFEAPEIKDYVKKVSTEYKIGLHFDQQTGDLRVDSTGKIVEANERDTWLQWCEKALLTQYKAFLGYDWFGVDLEYALSQLDKQAREDAIEQEIKLALMSDPARRTLELSNFAFEWGSDSVRVSFNLIGADGYTGELSVNL